MFGFLTGLWTHRRQELPRVVVGSDGFVVQAPDGRELAVRWTTVVAVHAYKRDLYAFDSVALVFKQESEPELSVQVYEDWPGFRDLFAPLQREFGISDRWYLETIRKPFETDFTTLFDRRSAP